MQHRKDRFLMETDDATPQHPMRWLVTWRETDGSTGWSQYDDIGDAEWKKYDLHCEHGIRGYVTDLDGEG